MSVSLNKAEIPNIQSNQVLTIGFHFDKLFLNIQNNQETNSAKLTFVYRGQGEILVLHLVGRKRKINLQVNNVLPIDEILRKTKSLDQTKKDQWKRQFDQIMGLIVTKLELF